MKRLETLFATVAGVALFAMMALTFADVVGRKLFDNSLLGAVELTEIFMLLMIFFALPLASIANEHIVFDLFDRVLPATALRLQKALSHGLTALIFGGASVIVWQRAMRTVEMGDETSRLGIKLGPFHYLIAVMLAVTALVHLWQAWREARGGQPAAPAQDLRA
jgi:TRAP-type C4-dicarboxylate transport system permease small subunit